MGRRGPAPKTTKLRLLEGNPGRVRINRREPKPRNEKPDVPDFLDEAAGKEFVAICGELESMGILHRCDHALIEAYAVTYSIFKRASSMQGKQGLVGKLSDKSDYIQVNPYVSIAAKAARDLKIIAQELGLSPAARTRIETGAVKSEGKDEILDW